ncbi:hypothetical protein HanPSC8_Chr10g0409611 [Helianthus annuus]|nr:hypothetical protein HanPSC8_Chr10g0409611 [Helianthus annuus]
MQHPLLSYLHRSIYTDNTMLRSFRQMIEEKTISEISKRNLDETNDDFWIQDLNSSHVLGFAQQWIVDEPNEGSKKLG